MEKMEIFFPKTVDFSSQLPRPAAALSIALQHEGLDQLGDPFATEVTENVHLAMGWGESHGVTWGLNLRIAGWWLSPTHLKNDGLKVSWDDDIPNWKLVFH